MATALRLNVPLAVAGGLLTNPLTTPIVYSVSFFLGRWVLGGDKVATHNVTEILLKTVTGSVILAFVMAVVGYLVILLVTLLVRRRRAKKKGNHPHVAGH